ncbi:alpha/beta fold hydrolase [Herbaspirillum hiltneri]|uniref:alpha/beta fold hydrolase n=1 Tax=Herbaspirillum hiltneri TaxID=341045 RepID=UPI00069D889A|nr:alpha/beta fold hydrolase [Herbaspirillum hiltneri]
MAVGAKIWNTALLAAAMSSALSFSLLLPSVAHAKKTTEEAGPPQIVTLGAGAQQYAFAIYANNSLAQDNDSITRAVILEHGVKRDGDRYFETGLAFLRKARLDPAQTLLLTPNFLTEGDALSDNKMALWRGDNWMQGQDSTHGKTGVSSFRVFDDIAAYLGSGRFPALKEIVFIGHSAGGQLMQRYAVLNNSDEKLKQAGIKVRYVISSPSSYLYFDNNRPADNGFAPAGGILCPGYDNYRYGLGEMIPYGLGADGKVSGEQLFKRYAARDVTYMVGSKDNNPNHRFLDKACGARLQGATRVERHDNYVRYEQFLAQKWKTPVHHPDFEVPGVGHDAAGLFGADITVEKIFPAK